MIGRLGMTNLITLNKDQHQPYANTVAGEQASVSPPIASAKNDLCGWDNKPQYTEFTDTTKWVTQDRDWWNK